MRIDISENVVLKGVYFFFCILSIFCILFGSVQGNYTKSGDNLYYPDYSEYIDPSCFDTIEEIDNPQYSPDSNPKCYDRSKNYEYFSCQLGFSPKLKNISRVSVINSHSLIGSGLVAALKKSNYNISEIKAQSHLDISDPKMIEILNLFNISIHIVIDMDINNFTLLSKLDAPVLYVSQNIPNQTNINNVYFLQSPLVFGPEYLSNVVPISQGPCEWIYCCLKNPFIFKRRFRANYSDKYAYSGDLGFALIEKMNQILSGQKLTPINVRTTNTAFFAKEILKIDSNCLISNIGKIDSAFGNRNQYKSTLQFMMDQFEPSTHVYASFVSTVCDINRVINGINYQLRHFSDMLYKFPSMPIEIIYVYGMVSEKSKSFFDTFIVPRVLFPHLRVITYNTSQVASLNDIPNVTSFPEYKIRNIGIKMAHGDYIFSATSDILPSILWFDCIQRRLFSPGIYRSCRYNTDNKTIIDSWINGALLPYPPIIFFEVFAMKDYNDVMSQLYTKASGDFEGAHRNQWEKMHGYLETGHVLHVDSWWIMEFSAFRFPIVVRFLDFHIHIHHIKVSHLAYAIEPSLYITENLMCQGFFSNSIQKYYRGNWGNPHLNVSDLSRFTPTISNISGINMHNTPKIEKN